MTATVSRDFSDVVVTFRLDGYESLDIPGSWLNAYSYEGKRELEAYRVLPAELGQLLDVLRKAVQT